MQFSLLFRNSTKRSTTPGVAMTSSIGGLGSNEGLKMELTSGYHKYDYANAFILIFGFFLPLDNSFLKRCVPMSCCSGELEKIICIMSSEITLPYDDVTTENIIIIFLSSVSKRLCVTIVLSFSL